MAHNQRCRGSHAHLLPPDPIAELFDQDFDESELDSLSTLRSSTPADFTNGAVIVLFDDHDDPALAVAIRDMPKSAYQPVEWVVRVASERMSISSVLLGDFRRSDSVSTAAVDPIAVDPDQLEAWCRIAVSLRDLGISLRDILVCEPQSWASLRSSFAASPTVAPRRARFRD